MRFCMKCGNPLAEGAKFCAKCGAKTMGETPQGAPSRPNPPAVPQGQGRMPQPMTPIQASPTQPMTPIQASPTQPMTPPPAQPQIPIAQPQYQYQYVPPVQQNVPQKPKKSLKQRFTEMTGGEGEQLYKFHKLFSGMFQHRTQDDWDVLITVGSSHARRKVMLPWLFLRVFIVCAVAFVLMIGAYKAIPENTTTYPGLFLAGALMVPLTVVVFLWECDWTRTISFMTVTMMILVGGALSLLVTFITHLVIRPLLGGDMQLNPIQAFLRAAFPEEIAKGLAVLALLRILKVRKISSALVVGSSVGGGFAFMETMGYGLNAMLALLNPGEAISATLDGKHWFTVQGTSQDPVRAIIPEFRDDSLDSLIVRAILAPGGHVVWAAITAAAFMLALKAGRERIGFTSIRWGKFLPLFCVPIVLHTLWDAQILGIVTQNLIPYSLLGMSASGWGEYFILTVLAWIVLTRLLNAGFRQYRDDLRNNVAANHA